jgi:hypothetical protein
MEHLDTIEISKRAIVGDRRIRGPRDKETLCLGYLLILGNNRPAVNQRHVR